MKARLRTPYGRVRITRESRLLVAIEAETECGALFGQGYAAGSLRLWQLELTRRVADGELSALFGTESLATDRLQRDLGLRALARRELARDASTPHGEQIRAYAAGIGRALDELRVLPIELVMMRHRPRAFTAEDVYLIAQLKYFINSAWQFELLHTLVAGKLGTRRAAQLFATFTAEGTTIDPLPRELDGEFAPELAATLAAGLRGLDKLGLSSPDIGSNAFAISGSRTASGYPVLAADPHMGNVNPGYNMLCKLVTDDGLAVVGSHFPGAPGIVVGRNRDCGWGMVGLMADNQDLFVGRVDAARSRVGVGDDWAVLERVESEIEIRGGAPVPHVAYRFAHGHMLLARGDHALFLRWPALDMPLGGVSLGELARATDWDSFRRGLARMTNAPMLAVYADRHGHRGYQAVGLMPKRARSVGSLVLSYDEPAHRWSGYHAFDDLPSALDPPGELVAYANQYSLAMFDGRPHISNRWHPPSRAWRIAELVDQTRVHDPTTACAIQDDRVDRFARDNLPYLLSLLPVGARLAGWDGDTRDTERALLFERWLVALVEDVTRAALPRELADRYADAWPGHRWNVLAILKQHAAEWGIADVTAVATRAYLRVLSADDRQRVEFRHTLRRHPIGRLAFSPSYPYDGGTRETIHVARRNTDFLTSSQTYKRGSGYHFGPTFKLVYDFSPEAATFYLANMPASGNPIALCLAPALRRWRRGRRYVTRLP